MLVEIELPEPPKGWRYTGEFRCAEIGEYYLQNGGPHMRTCPPILDEYHLIEKIEPRRVVLEEVIDPDDSADPVMEGWLVIGKSGVPARASVSQVCPVSYYRVVNA